MRSVYDHSQGAWAWSVMDESVKFYVQWKEGEPAPQAQPAAIRVDVPEVQDAISTASPNSIILDVRRDEELQAFGKIPTARNVPVEDLPVALTLPNEEFTKRYGFEPFTKDTRIISYCRTGRRSEQATRLLGSLGYGQYVTSVITACHSICGMIFI